MSPSSLTDLTTADRPRHSSSSSRRANQFHGRGGAGNIAAASATPELDPATLEIPTLKGEVYTTGRGGSGNMAHNTDPEAVRRAQDVVGHLHRESASSTHVGRGGAANVFKPFAEEVEKAKRCKAKWEEYAVNEPGYETAGDREKQRQREKGLADKGKEWLFGKK